MAITIEELEKVLFKAFPAANIIINDLVGDQDHYSLEICDKAFNGLSLINQHRLVKTALAEILTTKLHAITIKTTSPIIES